MTRSSVVRRDISKALIYFARFSVPQPQNHAVLSFENKKFSSKSSKEQWAHAQTKFIAFVWAASFSWKRTLFGFWEPKKRNVCSLRILLALGSKIQHKKLKATARSKSIACTTVYVYHRDIGSLQPYIVPWRIWLAQFVYYAEVYPYACGLYKVTFCFFASVVSRNKLLLTVCFLR